MVNHYDRPFCRQVECLFVSHWVRLLDFYVSSVDLLLVTTLSQIGEARNNCSFFFFRKNSFVCFVMLSKAALGVFHNRNRTKCIFVMYVCTS